VPSHRLYCSLALADLHLDSRFHWELAPRRIHLSSLLVQSPNLVYGVSPGVGVNSLAVSICTCSVVHDTETFGDPGDGGLLFVDTSHDAVQRLDRRPCIGKAWCVSSDVDCDANSISGYRSAIIHPYLGMYLLAFASRVEHSFAVVASQAVLNARCHASNVIVGHGKLYNHTIAHKLEKFSCRFSFKNHSR
jgi:hypothetical protein